MKTFKELSFHFLKGITAGIAISLGGFLYCAMVFLVPGLGGKVLGSILFSVGLFLVCSLYLSLYTGKIGLIYEGKQNAVYYASLPIMLVANLGAALGVGLLLHLAFQSNEGFMEVANSVVSSRLSLGNFDAYLSLAIKSFLCGLCVYMAVKLFALQRLKPLGIIMLVFFVFIFVYCGFEHCIANMFYFSFGNSWVPNAFIDLGLCILFNSLGTIPGVYILKMVKQDGQPNQK